MGPLKVNALAWRAEMGRLPTIDGLMRRQILIPNRSGILYPFKKHFWSVILRKWSFMQSYYRGVGAYGGQEIKRFSTMRGTHQTV
ncbi:hypothetical protein R6Q57_017358 [Mikania cordata]